jgi:RHS repeat-associated protein
MKTKLTFVLVAALTSTAFAGFQAPLPEFKNEKQLAEWRAEKASEATSQGYASDETAFYTGKPYLATSGNYAFKYRSYSPQLARWTSNDPSGFPDGANQAFYAPNPNFEFDPDGLATLTLNARYTSLWTFVDLNSNATITFELSLDKKSIASKSVGWGDILGSPSDNGKQPGGNGDIESASPSSETSVRYDEDNEGRFAIIKVHFLSVYKSSESANPINTRVGFHDSAKIRLLE